MAQIQRGVNFSNYPGTNSQVTADLLNNHVSNATLLAGAVSEQASITPLATDSILIQRATSLYKSTIQQVIDLCSAIFLPKSGGTMTGALTLNANPSVALGAATKQYVDTTVTTAVAGSTLVGAVVMWGGATIPSGWLEMNGQASPPSLVSIYGATLPDLRGQFVRGWNGSRSPAKDPEVGRALLSQQADAFRSHSHLFGKLYGFGAGNPGYSTITQSDTYDFNTTAVGGPETRPTNVALRFIVKT